MSLTYQSTRNAKHTATASEAILQGLAPDGGLYVPIEMPKLDLNFQQLQNQTYQEIAYKVMSVFLTDFTENELKNCINSAYDQKFTDFAIAPVVNKSDSLNYLELFHGPTIAFKDIALSILPHLMTTAVRKKQIKKEIIILTATSGDTGKAAMEGFQDVAGTKIIVFYPKNGVSPIQERQMLTQRGKNTFVVGINGNFDDAQTNVKQIFSNQLLNKQLAENGMQFSSANSINIGRLVPQIVYYVYAYSRLVKNQQISIGEEINFTVPTGNFGNILAGYYAKQLGVPIHKLICASNENNVLTDFFNTGTYDKNRPFHVTSSPSMDILVSSNLERLIFHLTGNQANKTLELMTALQTTGSYTISPEMIAQLTDFYAGSADEKQTKKTINETYRQTHYVLDPHTAVAKSVYIDYHTQLKDTKKSVIVATASPYKFPKVVLEALGESITDDQQVLIQQLEKISQTAIPKNVSELFTLPLRHQKISEPEDMLTCVQEILKLN